MRHEYVEIVWVATPATKPDHPPTSPGERWAYVAAALLVILGAFSVYRAVTAPTAVNPAAEGQKRSYPWTTEGMTSGPIPTEELLPDGRIVPVRRGDPANQPPLDPANPPPRVRPVGTAPSEARP